MPADAVGRNFSVDQDGQFLFVRKASAEEEYLRLKPQKEAVRWSEIVGLQSHGSGMTEGRKLRPMFEALTDPVRTLEDWRRTRPFSDDDLELVKQMRDALWLRLKCTTMQAKFGANVAAAFEEGRLEGEDKGVASALAKGRKQDQQGKQTQGQGATAPKQTKRGSSGGGRGFAGGSGNFGGKKCHNFGGWSHLQKDCPKPKAVPSK
jgi:hypothetical protein